MLKEAELSTLTSKECAKFGKQMKAIPKIELCAGRKVFVKPPQTFVKLDNGTIILQNDTRDMEDQPETVTDFFLGNH